MRFLDKPDRPPEAIRAFLAENLDLAVNLDYRHAPLRKSGLLAELVCAQGGLCAYTGVAIDERLSHRQSAGSQDGLRYFAHNEHVKPQSWCRQELVDRGLEPGRDLGEDMDHRNIVAALGVGGSSESTREIFGAAARPPNTLLPVLPTQPDCESRFRYLADGRIAGRDRDGATTIAMLRLDHATLEGWRSSAWDVFSQLFITADADQATQLRRTLMEAEEGRLLEFGYVLESILGDLEGRGEAAGQEAR